MGQVELKGKTIQTFNYGNCKRDFNYIDDVAEGGCPRNTKAPEQSYQRGRPAAAVL